jgi:predicted RNA-binding Zn-ribbon protein involved in translation (DUF1610 family)
MEDETISCSRCGQQVRADEAACPACGHLHGEPRNCARHDDREAAGVCVICEDAVCSDCNSGPSPHFACPAHGDIPVVEGWAQVYTTSDTFEADLIKENLESEGLDAAVLSQKDRSFAVDLGELSPVRILVPAYAYREAMRVLGAHMDNRGEVAFACPECGEAFDEGDAACRTCGAPLPSAG